MNEELQSATEQFDAMNREMRDRSDRLDQVNAFLESVLGSVLASVVVLDARFVVVSWNRAAEQLWGLWSNEVVGHSFFGLDVGIPLEQLRAPLLACLEGGSDREELVVTANNRRGREIQCRIAISPLSEEAGGRSGLVLLMEEVPAAADTV